MASHPPVPEGFKLHIENTAKILLPSTDEAFLNPVQEFNRDTSVACITAWSEDYNARKHGKWLKGQEKAARQADKRMKLDNTATTDASKDFEAKMTKEYQPYKFVLLEAFSATGLRAIRYAQEIPLAKYIIANDLSSDATAAMERNVQFNGLSPSVEQSGVDPTITSSYEPSQYLGKVRINEGDACSLMYSHREDRRRVDAVDLDPYGTAAPFIDASLQCIQDGGLLCVTCTDLAVLATNNSPEKCFANYGGIPLKAEYCHEAALRLVLHSISASAAKYGRYIVPMLSLSIDFYVRVFVIVFSGPIEVKKAMINTSTYYICSGCQSFYEQPLGKVLERTHEQSGNVNRTYKTSAGPSVGSNCPECGSTLHLAGPMWSGPLHDATFVSKVLKHIDGNMTKYKTSARMKGMLTVAKEELRVPFFFTPGKIASFFHCTCPPLDAVASALLYAGHEVSRSHACAGSLKTSASRAEVHDIFRSWVKDNPVKMENISETSPARQLLSKEPCTEANFSHHPQSVTSSSTVKLVRYQQNPTPHWGPAPKASGKRKRPEADTA